MITKQELIDFEQSVADDFNAGLIRFPIHLSKGNEDSLLEIFKDFKPGDYFFSTWRNHLHALLAGIPPEEVKRQIMAGRSMTVCSPEHHFFSSAIVSGCFPIAIGVAWEIKRRGGSGKVWIATGDMAELSGMAFECANYARWNDLPVVWIVENNGKSVCTITQDAWGYSDLDIKGLVPDYYYQWDLSAHFPHSGAGKRVEF